MHENGIGFLKVFLAHSVSFSGFFPKRAVVSNISNNLMAVNWRLQKIKWTLETWSCLKLKVLMVFPRELPLFIYWFRSRRACTFCGTLPPGKLQHLPVNHNTWIFSVICNSYTVYFSGQNAYWISGQILVPFFYRQKL